ncbi:MAG: hypothetical protein KIS77_14365 [Saprospiraceae bacterium]|nr:hypothetical protein [Saprospiraceae bacterium]
MKKMLSPPAKANTLLLMLVALWLLACYKDAPPPYVKPDPCPWPEITTQGLNTFGCKINGKEWVPCVDIYGAVVGLRPIDCTLRESDRSNFLGVDASYSMSSISDTSNLFFLGLKPLKEGVINPQDLAHLRIKFSLSYNGGLSSTSWSADSSGIGTTIEILRLDTSQNIIAGKFSSLLFANAGGDTLVLTDGRFDLKYYPQ